MSSPEGTLPRSERATGVALVATRSLPGQCELCRRWQTSRLCADCAPPDRRPRCEGCGLPLTQASLRCGACQTSPWPFERAVCAVDYGHPWDRLIAEFKYRGQVELAGVLAERLCQALDADRLAWPQVVLPVPLAPGRLAERGYNQAWELARRVGAHAGRPAEAHALQRVAGGVAQAGLKRAERQRNLAGVFRVARPAVVKGRRIALVDDVLTTGATAAAVTEALLAAGAAGVQVWALARTP